MSWDWLSFVTGALLGWLAQWALDLGYWRKRETSAMVSELMVEMERLRQENTELRRLGGRSAETARLLDDYRATLAACSMEIDQLTASHAQAVNEVASLKAQLAAAQTAVGPPPLRSYNWQQTLSPARQTPASVPPVKGESNDDLVLIDGISPKIAELLQGCGIRSYGQLAAANVEQLRGILDAAGTRFRFADPESWPYQARLAAAGEWDALMSWQRNTHGAAIVSA